MHKISEDISARSETVPRSLRYLPFIAFYLNQATWPI